jgi:tetratricopeptide (TPR) repeat protein
VGQWQDAEKEHLEAQAIYGPLVAQHPGYQEEQADNYFYMAQSFIGLRKPLEAEKPLQSAIQIQAELARNHPERMHYQGELAETYSALGDLLHKLHRHSESEAAFRKALTLQEAVADSFPNESYYRSALASIHRKLGLLYGDQNQLTKAREVFRLSLAIQEKLAKDYPSIPVHRIALGGDYVNMGLLERVESKLDRSIECYDKGIVELTAVLQQVKTDASATRFLRNAHVGRAQTLSQLNRFDEARKEMEKALPYSAPHELATVRAHIAAFRLRAGEVTLALNEAEKLAQTSDLEVLYNVACIFAVASDRKEESTGVPSKEDCANRAIALLRKAVENGFEDVQYMKEDDDLKSLRNRDEFKTPVSELEKAAPARDDKPRP